MPSTIELLCRLRFEVSDWQAALSGEREGLDELCAEVDSAIAERATADGYLCSACKGEVPHDSNVCPHCGNVDLRPCNAEASGAERLETIAAHMDSRAEGCERHSASDLENGRDDAAAHSGAWGKAYRRAAAIIRGEQANQVPTQALSVSGEDAVYIADALEVGSEDGERAHGVAYNLIRAIRAHADGGSVVIQVRP